MPKVDSRFWSDDGDEDLDSEPTRTPSAKKVSKQDSNPAAECFIAHCSECGARGPYLPRSFKKAYLCNACRKN